MPAVLKAARVLVTGASGFLATHLSRTLLERGHSVVGTVRTPAKASLNSFSRLLSAKVKTDVAPPNPQGRFLENLHQSTRFSYQVVKDIARPGAIDEVLRGSEISCVQHTASPFHFSAKDPDEIIRPAVQGTLGVLESVKKHGDHIRRVVLTSSTAAVISPKDSPYTFTEADWNDYSPAQVRELGGEASGSDKYQAGKVLAERAAWDKVAAYREADGGLKWDLVTLCPPFIFGPIIHEVPDSSTLNTSSAFFRSWMKDAPPKEQVVSPFLNLVDVRDVALAHVLAMELEQAGGERFIVSNGPFCIQDIYDDLHNPLPGTPSPSASSASSAVPRGWPGQQPRADQQHIHDGSKVVRMLGLRMTDRRKTVRDTLESL